MSRETSLIIIVVTMVVMMMMRMVMAVVMVRIVVVVLVTYTPWTDKHSEHHCFHHTPDEFGVLCTYRHTRN